MITALAGSTVVTVPAPGSGASAQSAPPLLFKLSGALPHYADKRSPPDRAIATTAAEASMLKPPAPAEAQTAPASVALFRSPYAPRQSSGLRQCTSALDASTCSSHDATPEAPACSLATPPTPPPTTAEECVARAEKAAARGAVDEVNRILAAGLQAQLQVEGCAALTEK